MLNDVSQIGGRALHLRNFCIGSYVVDDGVDAFRLFHEAGKHGQILGGGLFPFKELAKGLAVEREGGQGLPQFVRDHRGDTSDQPRALQGADAFSGFKLLGLQGFFPGKRLFQLGRAAPHELRHPQTVHDEPHDEKAKEYDRNLKPRPEAREVPFPQVREGSHLEFPVKLIDGT